ncbi:MAG: hypothetical protein PVF53_23250 [Desulfobacterales bacterium]
MAEDAAPAIGEAIGVYKEGYEVKDKDVLQNRHLNTFVATETFVANKGSFYHKPLLAANVTATAFMLHANVRIQFVFTNLLMSFLSLPD